jgi:hypothetical protein
VSHELIFTEEIRVAFRALRALTPEQRGFVLCWFCPECRAYIGPGASWDCEKHREEKAPP